MKKLKSRNSKIIIESKYDQLYIMTKYPTKYDSYQTKRGVVLTKRSTRQTNEWTNGKYIGLHTIVFGA